MDLGIILPLLFAAFVYNITGRLFVKKPSSKKKKNKQGKEFEMEVTNIRRIKVVSPFTDSDFVMLDGELRPKYSTLGKFLKHIDFEVIKQPYIDDYFQFIKIEAAYMSTIDNEFEGGGVCQRVFQTSYDLSLFTWEQREHADFHKFVEALLVRDLWNQYVNKYRAAFKHYAVLDHRLDEHP